MKFSSKMMIVALATTVAVPALAQRMPVGGSSSNKKPVENAKEDMADQPVAQEGVVSTTGRKYAVTTKGASKAIIELQNAVNMKDVANIPRLIAEAQKVAKTPDEKYLVASKQTQAAINANDAAAIRVGIDAMQASGAAEPADLAARYTELGKRFQTAKSNEEAAAAYTKALALNPNSASTLALFASLRDAQGQKAEAVSLMQKSFAASKVGGIKVAENNYKFAAGLAYSQRTPVANDIAREWVAAYPSPTAWRDTLRIYRDLNRPAQPQLIDLLRLGRATKSLAGEADYHSFGSALVTAGRLAEAKAVLAEARSAPNVDVTKRQFTDLNARLTAAPTRTAIDASAKTALAGGTAKAMIDAGDALYGVGAYAEAVPLYRAALAKGGDASLANLHLGMALAQSGDKAGASAALKAVTGPNADIARYWLLWLSPAA